jgi:hypothetical protein
MLRACMNPNTKVRSATYGSGFTTDGSGSLKQWQENWGNRPLLYFRICERAGCQLRQAGTESAKEYVIFSEKEMKIIS